MRAALRRTSSPMLPAPVRSLQSPVLLAQDASMRHVLIVTALVLSACSGPAPKLPGGEVSSSPSFADDVRFLSEHGEVVVLSSPEGAKVALSAKYQGRVMTSAVSADGRSLGW